MSGGVSPRRVCRRRAPHLEEAYEALRGAVEGHTKHLAPALKTIAECLTAGEAKPITVADLDADWEQWKATHPLPALRTSAIPDMTQPRPTLPTRQRRRGAIHYPPTMSNPVLGPRSTWCGLPVYRERVLP